MKNNKSFLEKLKYYDFMLDKNYIYQNEIEFEIDEYVPMPPKNSFKVNFIVNEIVKGEPSICDEVEIEL